MFKLYGYIEKYRVLLSNSGWLLGVEVLAKGSRIITIIALAASLGVADYGVVVLSLAAYEIFRLLLRSGVGAQIVQCAEEDLPSVAGNGLLIQWGICLSLTIIQIALAFPIGSFYQNPLLTELLIGMAFTYLVFPIVCLRVFMLHRHNKMRAFSIRNGISIVAENLSLALFAIFGAGVFSAVWGKWIFALTWLLVFFFSPAVHFGIRCELAVIKRLLKGTSQLLGGELSRALRLHLDILLAGKLLAPELFGLYGFAKNAGVGLTHSLSQAFVSALYPYLCQQNRQVTGGQYRFAYGMACAIALCFAAQAMLVPFYVPLIFGERWDASLMTTSMLCLLALPAILIDTRCAVLRSHALFHQEMKMRVYCLLLSGMAIVMAGPDTPLAFASVYLVSALAWLVLLFPAGKLRVAFSSANKLVLSQTFIRK